jgi:hypothetical protein
MFYYHFRATINVSDSLVSFKTVTAKGGCLSREGGSDNEGHIGTTKNMK